MTPSIYEVLDGVSKVKDEHQRALALRQRATKPVQDLLKVALDERIKWLLPEGDPPYRPDSGVNSHNVLMSETRKFYLFLDGYSPNINKAKREQLFIELLEAIHPDDARLLLAAKNKQLLWENITPEVVNEAFPGLVVGNTSTKKVEKVKKSSKRTNKEVSKI